MSAVQVSTLQLLEDVELPARQARAITETIDTEIKVSQETLEKKTDRLVMRVDDLEKGLNELRAEVAQLRVEMRHGFDLIRKEMDCRFAEIRLEFRKELDDFKVDLIRQMFTTIFRAMAIHAVLMTGIVYFIVDQAK